MVTAAPTLLRRNTQSVAANYQGIPQITAGITQITVILLPEGQNRAYCQYYQYTYSLTSAVIPDIFPCGIWRFNTHIFHHPPRHATATWQFPTDQIDKNQQTHHKACALHKSTDTVRGGGPPPSITLSSHTPPLPLPRRRHSYLFIAAPSVTTSRMSHPQIPTPSQSSTSSLSTGLLALS